MSEPSLPPPEPHRAASPPPSEPHQEGKAARWLFMAAIALILAGGGGLLAWEGWWQARNGGSFVRPLPNSARQAADQSTDQAAETPPPPSAPTPPSKAAPSAPPASPAPPPSAAPLPSSPASPPQASAPAPTPSAAPSRDDLAARIAALESRLAQVQAEAKPPVPPPAPGSNPADTKEIADLEAQVASLESRLKIAQDDASRATNAARAAHETLRRAVTAAVALAHLRANVDSGAPFEREYDEAMRALAFDPKADGMLQPLNQWAESGIATPADLRETLEAQGSDIVRAALFENAHTWWENLVARMKSLVIARPTADGDIPAAGTPEGDRPPAIVARAEAKLADDDVAGAVAELSALSGAAADTAGAWLAAARARVSADRTMMALEGTLRPLEEQPSSTSSPSAPAKTGDANPSAETPSGGP